MKRRVIIILILAVVLLGAVALFFGGRLLGDKPFGDLAGSDLLRVSVQLSSTEKTMELENLEEVTAVLQDIVVYQEADEFDIPEGEGILYYVTFSEGYQILIGVVDNYISIDGERYQAKDSSCEQLIRLANEAIGE